MKFKVNDQVQVVAGKDKGRKGKITKVFAKENKVVVEGINKYKRHIKRQSNNEPGQIVEVERALDASKVQIVSPHTKTISRIGYQITKSGDKIRICRKSGKPLDTK